MKKCSIIVAILIGIVCATTDLNAQEATLTWSPEEIRELFSFCEKPVLVNELKISEETADKIGQINYWATLQKLKVAANNSDTFATAKEVDEEVVKKYKALSLSPNQLKALTDRSNQFNNPAPCTLITLNYNKIYDTIPKPQLVALLKTRYRKMLIDKAGVNGRQADMLIEAEAWKHKEAQIVSTIAPTDFNRIRKTVDLNKEKERKYRLIDLTDAQKEAAIAFFNQQ